MEDLNRKYSQLKINSENLEDDPSTKTKTCEPMEISKLANIIEDPVEGLNCKIKSLQSFEETTDTLHSAIQNILSEPLRGISINFTEDSKLLQTLSNTSLKLQIVSALIDENKTLQIENRNDTIGEKTFEPMDICEEKPICSIYTKLTKSNCLQVRPHCAGTRNYRISEETYLQNFCNTGGIDGSNHITIPNQSGDSLRRHNALKPWIHQREIFHGFGILYKFDPRFKKNKFICGGFLKVFQDTYNNVRKIRMYNPNTAKSVVNHRLDQNVIFKNIDTAGKHVIWSALNYVTDKYGKREMLAFHFHTSFASKRFRQCISAALGEIEEQDSD